MRYTPTRAGSRRPLITKTNRRRGRNSRAIKTERERRVDLSQIVSLAPTHEWLILFSLSFPGRGRLAASWGPDGGDGHEMQLSFRGVSWTIIFEPLLAEGNGGRRAMGDRPPSGNGPPSSLCLRWPPSFFLSRKVAAYDACTFRPRQQGYTD